ncbi:MAG: peptidoglycan-binding lysin domain-containing protein [Bacillota bacterium]|nr:MAG: peptidoglycan-binding lysin domain-containing protein [Bacillota bacterium]MBS3949352.1 M23 family metallopeptidase [Peptococcaceae bacterium]
MVPEANPRVGQLTTQWQRGKDKIAAALISLVLIVGVVAQAGFAWQVHLNGEEIGVVKDKASLVALIEARTHEVEADKGYEVGLASQVEFRKIVSFSSDDAEAVKETLSEGLEFGLKATAIIVNGTEVAALATLEEAEGLLEQLKSRFIKTSSNLEVEAVRFREDVELEETYCRVEDIVDKDAALNVLLHGSEKLLQHTVARGESLWTIAFKYQLGVSSLKAANPNIKPEVLPIGSKLSLKLDEPFVRVEVVEKQTYNKSIPFATTYTTDSSLWTWDSKVKVAGKAGAQQVTARIVSVNGKEEKRDILSTQITASPTTQVVARGTKTAPSLSTGTFLWPTTGVITSPYGMRWGAMHSGVDIGAPKGTAIKAADSGMVTFSGWNGGYGYMVKIDHGNGTSTLYAHSSKLLVSQSSVVEKGQVIALVGSTGNSYGAHLHFEVHLNGKQVNPLNYFR